MSDPTGFVPPPYPQDRLGAFRRLADALPGGVVDVSIGNPIDDTPAVALDALNATAAVATKYPASIGSLDFRTAAAAYITRRTGAPADADSLIAAVGTKEFVASLPRYLNLRTPTRDTVLYPAVSYPTYAMGAQLAGLRAVPVPVDDEWHLDLSRITDEDAARALVLWVNEPSNPTSTVASSECLGTYAEWGRSRGVLVASDECYLEFAATPEGEKLTPATMLSSGTDGIISVFSMSKRSNMAGLRAGFITGDAELVQYLGEVRKHAGLMVPIPVQAAAAAALGDDAHIDAQFERYARRRDLAAKALADVGIVHDGGPMVFYLWLRTVDELDDGWELAARFADAGTLVAPGDLYGPAGADHVRFSLAVPDDRLDLALERLVERGEG